MSSNGEKVTVILPTLNESDRVRGVMDAVAQSPLVSNLIVADGHSVDDTVSVAKKVGHRLPIDFEVVQSKFRHTGKGAAMIAGIEAALKYKNPICFFDSDIASITPEWVEKIALPVIGGEVDMCRGFYDRARDDALITKHITRPLLALYFPELTHIRQPLGGELTLTSELASKLLGGFAPTHSWGIDTWLLIQASLSGAGIKEVYLGEKIHRPKDLVDLASMIKECFREVVENASHASRLRHRQATFHLGPLPEFDSNARRIRVISPVMLEENIRFGIGIKADSLDRLSHAKLFETTLATSEISTFKLNVGAIGQKEWIRTLHELACLYLKGEKVLPLVYKLWIVYSSGYILRSTHSFREAEDYVDEQCKTAFEMRKELLGGVK